jgi:hypothetical protein
MTIYTVIWAFGSIRGLRLKMPLALNPGLKSRLTWLESSFFFGSFGSKWVARDASRTLGTQQQVGMSRVATQASFLFFLCYFYCSIINLLVIYTLFYLWIKLGHRTLFEPEPNISNTNILFVFVFATSSNLTFCAGSGSGPRPPNTNRTEPRPV